MKKPILEMDELEVVDDEVGGLKSAYLSNQWSLVHRVKRTSEHLLEVLEKLDDAARSRNWDAQVQKEYAQAKKELLLEMREALAALK